MGWWRRFRGAPWGIVVGERGSFSKQFWVTRETYRQSGSRGLNTHAAYTLLRSRWRSGAVPRGADVEETNNYFAAPLWPSAAVMAGRERSDLVTKSSIGLQYAVSRLCTSSSIFLGGHTCGASMTRQGEHFQRKQWAIHSVLTDDSANPSALVLSWIHHDPGGGKRVCHDTYLVLIRINACLPPAPRELAPLLLRLARARLNFGSGPAAAGPSSPSTLLTTTCPLSFTVVSTGLRGCRCHIETSQTPRSCYTKTRQQGLSRTKCAGTKVCVLMIAEVGVAGVSRPRNTNAATQE